MDIIPRPKPVDLKLFDRDIRDRETKFGLPSDVAFCSRCILSNQRPQSSVEFKSSKDTKKKTLGFDEEGICDACRVAESKALIDWEAREKELRDLCDRFRRDDGKYDCIVPGSGGKDSFFAAHKLKYEYGMHPLTVTWAPHIYTEWGWRNFQKWIHAGFDNYLHTPNGPVHRILTRLAMDNLLHPFQPFIIGQKSIAAKFSIAYDIPLVFYGENEAEYGNAKSESAKPTRDKSFYSVDDISDVRLGGVSVEDLVNNFDVDLSDIQPYLPPSAGELEKANTEVHYLGYYLRWHPQGCYYYAQEHGGFEPSPERTTGTYSKYNSIDDRIDDVHFYASFVKFGFGRATRDASQEIRSGEIDREEAIALARRYDGEYPERFLDEVLEYMSLPEDKFPKSAKMFEAPVMDRAYFDDLCDSYRPQHLWNYENGSWIRRHTAWGE